MSTTAAQTTSSDIIEIADTIKRKLKEVLDGITTDFTGAAGDLLAAAETLKILREIYQDNSD